MLPERARYRIVPAAHAARCRDPQHSCWRESHSPTDNFYFWLRSAWQNAGQGLIDTAGVQHLEAAANNFWGALAGNFNSAYGIIVGGEPWFAANGVYNLRNPFLNGVGPEFVLYTPCSATADTNSNPVTGYVTRNIQNQSGAPINVQEMALVLRSTGGFNNMFYYDPIPAPVEVPPAVPFTVQYLFSTQYPT